MPNFKDILIDFGTGCLARVVSSVNKHVADPEQADCDCQLHEQAKIDAALAAYDPTK